MEVWGIALLVTLSFKVPQSILLSPLNPIIIQKFRCLVQTKSVKYRAYWSLMAVLNSSVEPGSLTKSAEHAIYEFNATIMMHSQGTHMTTVRDTIQ